MLKFLYLIDFKKITADISLINHHTFYGRAVFCVKSDAALSCGINIAETTLSMGLRLQYISIFKQIKARRL